MKRGQITIFVLVGVLIVAAIIVAVLWVKPEIIFKEGTSFGFEACVKDAVHQGIKTLEKNGGYINPGFSYTYFGQKVPYLCYTPNYLELCTVYEPLLIKNFEEELKASTNERIKTCYSNSLKNLKSQGYEVTEGEIKTEILLELGLVKISIDAPTIIGSQNFEKFNFQLNSPVYETLSIATSILQFESSYGESNIDSIMILYPDYLIEKMKQGDGTTIYSIKQKTFKTEFWFATRSLVYPPGYYLS